MDLYLKLPYRGELELLAEHLTPNRSVLELGCGTGRLTRPLLEKSCAVTAVDNSAEMLRHVPDAAAKVLCDIETLDLGRAFDVVLLASNLINVADAAIRNAQLAACRRHLGPRGKLIFQRFDPGWLRAVEPGPSASIGDVEVAIERVHRHEGFVDVSIRYAVGGAEWRQHFTARMLDDDGIRAALLGADFHRSEWIDARWGMSWIN